MGNKHSRQENSNTFFSSSPYDYYDREKRRQELEAELRAAKNALDMCSDASDYVTVTSAYSHAKEAKKIKKKLKQYR